jgi:hypothetical protein
MMLAEQFAESSPLLREQVRYPILLIVAVGGLLR